MRSLVILATKLSKNAIALLLSNRKPEVFQVIAVNTPGVGMTERVAAMEDLAALTGGRPIIRSAGDTLAGVKLHDLGHARRAWSDNIHFGVVGGKGNSRKLRQHIANLRAFYDRVDDIEERGRIRQRIGKLMGGSAALIVGGVNEIEIDARKVLAQRTADAMRGAVREGVLPGGGVALMACRTILAQKGEIKHAGLGHGFDVNHRKVDKMIDAGIYDVASVVKEAASRAITSAGLALTTDVLLHCKNPEKAITP